MKTNEQQLLKHFASVLRNRANGQSKLEISKTILKYLTRKDLIEVLKKANNGILPKDLDITFMENEELLLHIKDELFIIAYVTEKMCKHQQSKIASVPLKTSNSDKSNSGTNKKKS
jgi:hypothetical protein